MPLEIKYSTHSKLKVKPKWNSNIPKANSIYLFADPNNFTYFMGADYLSPEIRNEFIDYFNNFNESECLILLKQKITNLNQNDNSLINPFGLYPKIRIDYLEIKDFEIGNQVFSKYNTIFDFAKINKWEEQVINYLNNLERVEYEK